MICVSVQCHVDLGCRIDRVGGPRTRIRSEHMLTLLLRLLQQVAEMTWGRMRDVPMGGLMCDGIARPQLVAPTPYKTSSLRTHT